MVASQVWNANTSTAVIGTNTTKVTKLRMSSYLLKHIFRRHHASILSIVIG